MHFLRITFILYLKAKFMKRFARVMLVIGSMVGSWILPISLIAADHSRGQSVVKIPVYLHQHSYYSSYNTPEYGIGFPNLFKSAYFRVAIEPEVKMSKRKHERGVGQLIAKVDKHDTTAQLIIYADIYSGTSRRKPTQTIKIASYNLNNNFHQSFSKNLINDTFYITIENSLIDLKEKKVDEESSGDVSQGDISPSEIRLIKLHVESLDEQIREDELSLGLIMKALSDNRDI